MRAVGRVLIVDDHALFRSGLAQILESKGIEVVGEAADGIEAIEWASRVQPDVILMDVRMPRLNGLEATRAIVDRLPSVKVIMLTVSDADEDLFAAIRAGAAGYLLKNVSPDELLRLLQGIAEGEAPISGVIAGRLLREFGSKRKRPAPVKPHQADGALTPREIEVLACIAAGRSNREAGMSLAISENTVKNHLRRILEKLHLENRIQVVAWAIHHGLVHESETPGQNG